MSTPPKSKHTTLITVIVLSITVAGYFTGLQAPMNRDVDASGGRRSVRTASPTDLDDGSDGASPSRLASSRNLPSHGVIPATPYAGMAEATAERRRHTRLAGLKSAIDPLAEITISPEEKLTTLDQREQNRSFNGAPPTIPHPVDQRSDASCVACHREGAKSKSLRIPRMSHAFLANCTQCHIESNPRHMTAFSFRENDFAGLAAPTEGPRAFKDAPPQIPHSTWMRSDCLSCHGHAGLHGIRTTHPWRKNCQQCHAPSASLDQTLLAVEPQFLPGPDIKE